MKMCKDHHSSYIDKSMLLVVNEMMKVEKNSYFTQEEYKKKQRQKN